MLTPRQNLIECIKGGKPDRFVNQFEYMKSFRGDPFIKSNPSPKKGMMNVVNAWGVTRSYPENTPGAFPVHTPDKIVCPDVTHWRDYVKAPNVKFSDAEWEDIASQAAAVNREEYFVTAMITPGIFEQCHYLMEIQNTLMNFYEEPDDMKDLIKYLADWEVQYAEELCKHLKPDCIFHHDDWGTQKSTFLSPDMFDEFYLDAYKQVYGYYKENGVELIVHHSDSYAATLVPSMIEMGIDIWQGVMVSNDIENLIKQYGGKISFMGGIDSATVDYPGWTPEVVKAQVERACRAYGGAANGCYYIPCASVGGPTSTFPGVYDTLTEEINNMSKVMF